MARDYDYDEEENEQDEEEKALHDLKMAIMNRMKVIPPTSEEYMVLAQRLDDITSCARNKAEEKRNYKECDQIDDQKWAWILPTLCQVGGNIVGNVVSQSLNRRTVNDVIGYENNGGLVSGKAPSFIQKPR